MSETKDTYKTITEASPESLFKDRGSKFFGYAFPVTSEGDIDNCIQQLKKQHHTARHWCYAWQLGKSYDRYRANDDGEPSNSAGMPIYGQLQAFDITNVLVVVVRYFGGTKLGVGGLIQAYKAAAQETLTHASIVEKTIDESLTITFEYPEMNTVMRIIKDEKLRVVSQEMQLSCEITMDIRQKDYSRVFQIFSDTYKVNIKKRDS